jgi:serine/threonine protein kinase
MPSRANPEEAVPVEWKEGDVILGVYEVKRLLGRGGMGSVFQVHHRGWDVDLAVKWPKPEAIIARRGADLFERECETWVNLGLHPNVTTCYYVRRLGGLPRVFAEFVSGGNLSFWVRHGKLYAGPSALERIFDVLIQIAWGLRYAHSQGIIHLDIKSANVLMTPDGAAKVTDFGLARALYVATASEEGDQPRRGGPRGTPVYSSPEQANREPLTLATDIWSWAVVALELFVGEVTWMAGPAALQALEGYIELGPENTAIPPMPERLVALLRNCFDESPAKRPTSMADVIAELLKIYEEALGFPYARKQPEAVETSVGRLNNRAVSLMDLGKKEEALETWERALRFEPEHPEAMYNHALARWRAGATTDQSIMRALRDLCRSRPADWTSIYMFAQVRLERGDYEGALKMLRLIKGSATDGHEVRSAWIEAENNIEKSRRLVRAFGDDVQNVSALCLSGDGHLALTATSPETGDGSVTVWDATTGAAQIAIEGHKGSVRCVALSADGIHVLTGGADGTARLCVLATGECERVLRGHQGPVNAAMFSDDGRMVLTGGTDGVVRMWDRATGEKRGKFAGHKGEVKSLCYGAHGMSFLSSGADNALIHWDLKNGSQLGAIHSFPSPLLSVAVSNDRRYLVAGSADGFLEYLDLISGKRLGRRRGHSEPVTAVCLSKRGQFALTGGHKGKVRLWETSGHRCLFTYKAYAPIAVGADGQMALTIGEKGGLKLWYIGFEMPIHAAPLMVCRA